MKIAAASLNQTPLDWEGNTFRILSAIQQAREANSKILVLPELCLTGYGCDDYFYMPWLEQKAQAIFKDQIVPQTSGILVAVGLPTIYEGKLYNTLGLALDGRMIGYYAKQILAGSGVYYEPRWFTAWKTGKSVRIPSGDGDIPFGDFSLSAFGITVGFEICEDAWHPESRPAICGAASHADLILNASASNFARGKQAERHEVIKNLKGRNDAYYLYTNLLGNESGRLIFDGEILFGACGEIWKSGNRFSMNSVCMEVFDLDEFPKNEPFDYIEEDDFEQFTAACSLALLDYLRKAKSKGFALSLSGGADSATCAILVFEMLRRAGEELGKKALEEKIGLKLKGDSPKDWCNQILICAYQSTQNSSDITRNAAAAVAEEIGARFVSWQIDEMVKGYTQIGETALGRKLSWETDDLVLQNIQARTRAPGIWLLANQLNFLLLTTSNRSEGDVGYCTMDGDTAGSLAPIAGVSKHFIRNWLIWAKETRGYSSLEAIINQAPTAELRPLEKNQTDEADLMPYDLLEEIERLWIYEKLPDEEVLNRLVAHRSEGQEYLRAMMSRFQQLWYRSQWKRERLAPSFHLDRFNIDPKSGGRFPILTGS